MTEGNDASDRNLERLIRAAADPPSPASRARREFLARVEGKSPSETRMGRMTAMAASLIVAAAILYSVLAPQSGVKPETSRVPSPESGVDAAPIPPKGTGSEPVAVPSPIPPAPAAGVTAKDDVMALTCSLSPARAAVREMRLEGVAPFPDGTEVMVTVIRYHEEFAGGRLITRGVRSAGGRARVDGKRFRLSPLWDGPGRYAVSVAIDESQRPELVEPLKRFPRRPSTFEFAGWGDELSGQLGPKLRDLDAVSRECLDMVARIEKLAASESAWVKEKRNVDARGADVILTKEAEEALKETARLMERLEKSDVKALFPAAHGEMFFTLRSMHGNAQHFSYESGKFAGARSYHSGGDALKTHRQQPFNFENLKKYLGEVPSIAGRELALWMVRDLRRGAPRESYAELLKAEAKHAGLEPLADRLSKAAPGELDALETEIRAGK